MHKDSLTREVRTFITNSNGACKPKELYDHLRNNDRYPSYMWIVHCQTGGTWYSTHDQNKMIYLKYNDFSIFVGWQDRHSPSGIVSRYTRGKARAAQHLSSVSLNCNVESMREKVKQELNTINLDRIMVIVMIRGSFSYYGSGGTGFSVKRHVDCPKSAGEQAATWISSLNPFALIDNLVNNRYSSTRREKIVVVVIGARERSRSGSAKRTSGDKSLSSAHFRDESSVKQTSVNGCKRQRNGKKKQKGKCNNEL